MSRRRSAAHRRRTTSRGRSTIAMIRTLMFFLGRLGGSTLIAETTASTTTATMPRSLCTRRAKTWDVHPAPPVATIAPRMSLQPKMHRVGNICRTTHVMRHPIAGYTGTADLQAVIEDHLTIKRLSRMRLLSAHSGAQIPDARGAGG